MACDATAGLCCHLSWVYNEPRFSVSALRSGITKLDWFAFTCLDANDNDIVMLEERGPECTKQ